MDHSIVFKREQETEEINLGTAAWVVKKIRLTQKWTLEFDLGPDQILVIVKHESYMAVCLQKNICNFSEIE